MDPDDLVRAYYLGQTWYHGDAKKKLLIPCLNLVFVAFQIPTLLCDNQSALALTHIFIFQTQTKHVELGIHLIREQVIAKPINSLDLSTLDQVVDSQTKPLSPLDFKQSGPNSRCFQTNIHLEFVEGMIDYTDKF